LAAANTLRGGSATDEPTSNNALLPKDPWLTDEERQHVIAYHDRFPLEGYRLPTSPMLDEDVVAARPAIVCGVLCAAGLLDRWNRQPFKEGSGFLQALQPHQH
jgi:hypothetical protein